MAQGPDPNDPTGIDPELTAEETRKGGGPGDPASGRAGLSSWAIAVITVIVTIGLLVLLL